MRTPHYTGQFRRDVKRAKRRGKDMEKLRRVLRLLIEEEPLPTRLRDHPLKGDWKGCRDLHIEPDWLLLHSLVDDVVRFERTGTHSDLFGE